MTALLVIIYISFISLGLPDALLGAAWPVMSGDLGAPLSLAGMLSMIVAGGTIVSSLMSERVIRRFGTGLVTACSVTMTAIALLGIAISSKLIGLCLFAVPLGLGAGAVDTALNNFVALHYKARHMNWLHCFWGVGATAGPAIMSLFLTMQGGWKLGYGSIGALQVLLVIALFVSLKLWKNATGPIQAAQAELKPSRFTDTLRTPGVKPTMLCFFAYCALELTTGLWGSSYLVNAKGIPAASAAQWISYFYLGITAGRFLSGFLSMRLKNTAMIGIGMAVIGVGLVLVLLPFHPVFLQIGLALTGLGCAPIFPAMLHETPRRFGAALSQRLIGLQMASAYLGSTLAPLVFSAIVQYVDIALFPYYLVLMLGLMAVSSKRVDRTVTQNRQTEEAPCAQT